MKPFHLLFALIAINIPPASRALPTVAPPLSGSGEFLRTILGITNSSPECIEALKNAPYDKRLIHFLRELSKANFAETCSLFDGQKPDLSALTELSEPCASSTFSLDNFMQAPCERDKQKNLCLVHYSSWEERVSSDSSDNEFKDYLALACPHDCRNYLVGYAAEQITFKIKNNMPTDLEPHNLCSEPDGWEPLEEGENSAPTHSSEDPNPTQQNHDKKLCSKKDDEHCSDETERESNLAYRNRDEQTRRNEESDAEEEEYWNANNFFADEEDHPPQNRDEVGQKNREHHDEDKERKYSHANNSFEDEKRHPRQNRDEDGLKDREQQDDANKGNHSKDRSTNESSAREGRRTDREGSGDESEDSVKEDSAKEDRSQQDQPTKHHSNPTPPKHLKNSKDPVDKEDDSIQPPTAPNGLPEDDKIAGVTPAPASEVLDDKQIDANTPSPTDGLKEATSTDGDNPLPVPTLEHDSDSPSPSLVAGVRNYATAITAVVFTIAVTTAPLLS